MRELECKLEESSKGAQGKEMEEREQGCKGAMSQGRVGVGAH